MLSLGCSRCIHCSLLPQIELLRTLVLTQGDQTRSSPHSIYRRLPGTAAVGRGRVKTQGCLDEEVSYTEATGFFGAAVYEAIHRRRGTNPGDVAAGVSGGLR